MSGTKRNISLISSGSDTEEEDKTPKRQRGSSSKDYFNEMLHSRIQEEINKLHTHYRDQREENKRLTQQNRQLHDENQKVIWDYNQIQQDQKRMQKRMEDKFDELEKDMDENIMLMERQVRDRRDELDKEYEELKNSVERKADQKYQRLYQQDRKFARERCASVKRMLLMERRRSYVRGATELADLPPLARDVMDIIYGYAGQYKPTQLNPSICCTCCEERDDYFFSPSSSSSSSSSTSQKNEDTDNEEISE